MALRFRRRPVGLWSLRREGIRTVGIQNPGQHSNRALAGMAWWRSLPSSVQCCQLSVISSALSALGPGFWGQTWGSVVAIGAGVAFV